MCGIIGAVGDIGQLHERFRFAVDSLAHRGPDGSGVFASDKVILGQRRLAVIDLSTAADQPMIDPETGLAIVFNGEIYNYIEIRNELAEIGHRFRTRSDTEVLLKAWVQWKEKALDRLNGMWAFAIWDPARQSLFLSRDRFGVKPLYYARIGGAFVFASEPKAILALDESQAEPDLETLVGLWVESSVQFGDHSFYRAVGSFPPASWGVVTPDCLEVRPKRFWQYPEPDPLASRPHWRAAEDSFDTLFRDAVRLRLRSDVPVGLTLSGGLDSSGVLAACRSFSEAPMRCFTAVYGDDRGEEHWARLAAGHDRGVVVPVDSALSDWVETLGKIVHHMDGPGYTPAVFPLWKIMACARSEGVPVLLEGQGGDELLGGYTQYLAAGLLGQVSGLLRGDGSLAAISQSVRGMIDMAGLQASLRWVANLAMNSMPRRIGPRAERLALAPGLGDVAARLHQDISPTRHPAPYSAQLADHSRNVLPALLHYGDAISMAHGIEVRLPFMDYRLVEWVFRDLPPLFVDGESKHPLRAFLRRNGMSEIAARKDKVGFRTPLRELLTSAEGKALVADFLDDPNAQIWSLFDRNGVRAFVQKAIAGDAFRLFHVYKLLTIHIWLRQLSERKLRPSRDETSRPLSQAA